MTNPLEDFAKKLVHEAISEFDAALQRDTQLGDEDTATFRVLLTAIGPHAQAVTEREFDDALETYGIVAGYPLLLQAAQELVEMWRLPGLIQPGPLAAAVERLRQALIISSQFTYLAGAWPEGQESKPTPDDIPL